MKAHLYPSEVVRNQQVGDWFFVGDELHATSVPLPDPRYEFLIQFHELVESMLCEYKGITDEEVTAFDELFEVERNAGLHGPDVENGDDTRAPYFEQHQMATIMERLMALQIDVDWKEYEKAIHDVFHKEK